MLFAFAQVNRLYGSCQVSSLFQSAVISSFHAFLQRPKFFSLFFSFISLVPTPSPIVSFIFNISPSFKDLKLFQWSQCYRRHGTCFDSPRLDLPLPNFLAAILRLTLCKQQCAQFVIHNVFRFKFIHLFRYFCLFTKRFKQWITHQNQCMEKNEHKKTHKKKERIAAMREWNIEKNVVRKRNMAR